MEAELVLEISGFVDVLIQALQHPKEQVLHGSPF